MLEFLLWSKKAVVAAVLAGAGWLLSKYGLDVDVSVREAVEALVAAAVSFVSVWYASNRK